MIMIKSFYLIQHLKNEFRVNFISLHTKSIANDAIGYTTNK